MRCFVGILSGLFANREQRLSSDFDGGQLSSNAGLLLLRGGGEKAWSGRSAYFVYRGMAQARAHRAPACGDAQVPDVRDRFGLRGRRRLRFAEIRSNLQDGGGPFAGERRSAVLAADDVASGECALE